MNTLATSRVLTKKAARHADVLLIEDDASCSQNFAGDRTDRNSVTLRLLLIRRNGEDCTVLDEQTYTKGTLANHPGGRAAIALEMLDGVQEEYPNSIVVAGSDYGASTLFLKEIIDRSLEFAVELPHSTYVHARHVPHPQSNIKITELIATATFSPICVDSPGAPSLYTATEFGVHTLSCGIGGRIFAFEAGGISGIHRGTIFGLSNIRRTQLGRMLHAVGWVRWFRVLSRRSRRESGSAETVSIDNKLERNKLLAQVPIRANITLSRMHDEKTANVAPILECRKGKLTSSRRSLRMLELFAGAGGMGLGFQLGGREDKTFQLIHSAEINPIYVETLKFNYDYLQKIKGLNNAEKWDIKPIDLSEPKSIKEISTQVERAEGVDIIIGGPPCQGFSNANRNSWASDNPNNRLVDVFLKYVDFFRPSVFVMENVQGILWTAKKEANSSSASVVSYLAKKMASMGYVVFPKLIDAIWSGVPQYRSRFFLLGIHQRLGYSAEDFGEWGPFPRPTHGPGTAQPFVSVRDAIADLPSISNGHLSEVMPYSGSCSSPYVELMRTGMPPELVYDHVTSKHADYVLKRYESIPPGGNWQDVKEMLTNYSNISRTHSNIYRRLTWDEPAITIGHYRKSMLIHPDQARGLSLREASRLQSFPDWFKFQGSPNSRGGGLMHKQQQLANAVSPLVAKAIANYILDL